MAFLLVQGILNCGGGGYYGCIYPNFSNKFRQNRINIGASSWDLHWIEISHSNKCFDENIDYLTGKEGRIIM